MDRILILAGGYSNEREISLITAKSVTKELKKNGKYKLLTIEPDGSFIKKLRKFKPRLVLNLLHGRYGEDGYIQSILESEKVKYTHSGVLSSSLAIDKEISKKIFIKNKILTPPYYKYVFKKHFCYENIIKKIESGLKFPVVLKPINEGSSVGVCITNKKNFINNLIKLEKFREILIEKYIPGREIQAAILGNKKLGIIELKPKRKFYDYEAKYSKNAKTEHIIPVNITNRNFNKINSIAMKAHKLLNCRGVF
jgi:D-alanine-D-alanine ligase